MEEFIPISIGTSLKDIIFDQYPVSFIVIVLVSTGYILGHMIFIKQKIFLEKTASDLIIEIIKSMK